jgi:hypothetical protein
VLFLAKVKLPNIQHENREKTMQNGSPTSGGRASLKTRRFFEVAVI